MSDWGVLVHAGFAFLVGKCAGIYPLGRHNFEVFDFSKSRNCETRVFGKCGFKSKVGVGTGSSIIYAKLASKWT